MQSVQGLLNDRIHIRELIVYDNHALESVSIMPTQVAILSSPLNVKSYFKNAPSPLPETFIAIGETTKKALSEQGIKKVLVPAEPTEGAIVELMLGRSNK